MEIVDDQTVHWTYDDETVRVLNLEEFEREAKKVSYLARKTYVWTALQWLVFRQSENPPCSRG